VRHRLTDRPEPAAPVPVTIAFLFRRLKAALFVEQLVRRDENAICTQLHTKDAKVPRDPSDNRAVQQTSWTFIRGNERLELSREKVDDGTALVVAGDGAPRSYFFRDFNRLEVFQRDMETLLLKTGWTFQAYSPDRRAGRDRRGWPRRSNDRRRWWTDGRSEETVDVPKASEPREEKTGTDAPSVTQSPTKA
jgi:hypothetical protein